ncbi:hypothetical protein ACJRO7_022168 [Eucalyptus globulus]|uniref:Pentatricopeptide repeat-containing protein n=1 Tax=Eucalyptus globulus TaxID=34317 RepID=A0ABD3KTJ7_EUCGL
MISFCHLQRGLSKFSSRRRLWTSCALDHGGTHEANASSVASLLAQSRQQPDSPSSTQAHAKMVATLLSECGDKRGLSLIHAHVIRSRLLDSNPVAFHWNIIRAYARLDAPRKALLVYAFMARAGVPPDSYTLPIVLKAVCRSFDFEAGRLHVPAAEEPCLLFSGLHPDQQPLSPPADEQQNPDSKLFFEEDENWLLKSLSKLTNPSMFPTSDPPNLDRRAGVRTGGDHDQDAEAVRGRGRDSATTTGAALRSERDRSQQRLRCRRSSLPYQGRPNHRRPCPPFLHMKPSSWS